MKRAILLCCLLFFMLCLSACAEENTSEQVDTARQETETVDDERQTGDFQETGEADRLKITVGDHVFYADFAQNDSAREFKELLSQGAITVSMEDYGGFEKVGSLGAQITRNDERITTVPGDIILYQGNQICIYYGTNTWNFTRLASIQDADGLAEKLGNGSIEAVFSLE